MQLSQVQTEAAEIINQAEETAQQQGAALRQEAYDEAERVLVQAQLEMAHWRERAVAEFHDDLLNTILAVSAKLMAQAAPPALHDTLVQQLSERILQMGREEMQRVETIRRSLRDREPTVYVTTARPLTTTQQGQLVRTFTALVDRNVSLELKTDADLAAGLHIRLGDLVVGKQYYRAVSRFTAADCGNALPV
ncbi:MAG: F0F1 ATP synthase subunit delta [Chloroflexi bacterium]|nr:F0F1 ATP synthase subunit delta [Chloroflexota bacterium]